MEIGIVVNELFNWQFFTFLGITLEIIGFILMTFRWGIHPTMEQWQKWRDDHKSYFDKWYQNHMKRFSTSIPRYRKSWYYHMYVDDVVEGDEGKKYLKVKYLFVPGRFQWYWNGKTKIPSILPVIVGLGFQGLQIFLL